MKFADSDLGLGLWLLTLGETTTGEILAKLKSKPALHGGNVGLVSWAILLTNYLAWRKFWLRPSFRNFIPISSANILPGNQLSNTTHSYAATPSIFKTHVEDLRRNLYEIPSGILCDDRQRIKLWPCISRRKPYTSIGRALTKIPEYLSRIRLRSWVASSQQLRAEGFNSIIRGRRFRSSRCYHYDIEFQCQYYLYGTIRVDYRLALSSAWEFRWLKRLNPNFICQCTMVSLSQTLVHAFSYHSQGDTEQHRVPAVTNKDNDEILTQLATFGLELG